MEVQDIMMNDLYEDSSQSQNEMLEILQFTKANGVPLSEQQVIAGMELHEAGLGDIFEYYNNARPELTPTSKFFRAIDKITLGDRIKGTAKLGNLLKAQVASTTNTMPNASQYQAKGLKEKELNR